MDISLRKLSSAALLRRLVKISDKIDATTHPALWHSYRSIVTREPSIGVAALRTEMIDLVEAIELAAAVPAAISTPAHTSTPPAPTLPANWTAMRLAATSQHLEYPRVTFPVKLIDASSGRFQFANGVEARFDKLGAGYMSERITTIPYAQWTLWHRDGRWEEMERAINAASLPGEYVAAILDGAVLGVMSNYNAVQHAELLDIFEKENLAQHLLKWEVLPTHLEFDLKVADVANNLIATVRVRNGQSGHFALRFTVALVAEGYEWEAGGNMRRGRKRHLSNVSTIVEQLKKAVDDAATVLFDQNLKAISFTEAVSIIETKLVRLTLRQEQLLRNAQDAKAANALEIVSLLAPYGATVGWAAAVSGLLDPLVERAASM